jgi:hypothetical protein
MAERGHATDINAINHRSSIRNLETKFDFLVAEFVA